MLYSTAQLRKIVAPDDLEDVLQSLKDKKIIKFFIIMDEVTSIRMERGVDIRVFFSEQTKPVPNPTPYVKNKRNK